MNPENKKTESSGFATIAEESPRANSIPGLKPYQLALILTVASIILPVVYPSRSVLAVVEFVGWPVSMLAKVSGMQHLDAAWGTILWIVTGLLYLFLVWFIPVWGWGRSSRHMKFALLGCVLLCAMTAWGLKAYRERVDWTSRGLNPSCPGLHPPVVKLAGTFHYSFIGMDTGWIHTGDGLFEIRMRGHDFYYCRRWTGHRWKYGSFDNLEISVPDFSGHFTWSYSGSGHHGRGGSGDDKGILPGRRLWDGKRFVGLPTEAYATNGYQTERFIGTTKIGPYDFPQKIEFTSRGRSEVFTIRKIEFLCMPSEEWFRQVQHKHFMHDTNMTTLHLNEPGWEWEDARRKYWQ